MKTKAPPIQWLPVFEAAGRLLNFKKAAAELCVSPPAISQQIRVLEDYLGVALFERTTKRVTLTPAGEFYYQRVSQMMKLHTEAYRQFENKYRNPTLRLSAPIFIAQELLIPSYPKFADFAPNIELRITTGNEYVDFDTEPMDAALRFGPSKWPSLDCRLLSTVTPKLVCSPHYLSQHGIDPNKRFDTKTLRDHVLLSVFEDLRDWQQVNTDLDTAKTIICDSYFSVIRSAEEGLGVAVGLLPVIRRLIDEGKLVELNTQSLSTDYAYWLVAPKSKGKSSHIEALYNWLRSLFDQLDAS